MITTGEPDLTSVSVRGAAPPDEQAWLMEHQRIPTIIDRLKPIYVTTDLPPMGNELSLVHEILDAKLASLADLPDNWDSYGAKAPSAAIVRDARAALKAIFERLGYRWTVMKAEFSGDPLPDGIALEWTREQDSMFVMIVEGGYRWFRMAASKIVDGPHRLPDGLDLWADEVLCTFLFPQGPVIQTPDYGDYGG